MPLLVLTVVGYLIAVIVLANLVDRGQVKPQKPVAALAYPYIPETAPATTAPPPIPDGTSTADTSNLRTLHMLMLSLMILVVLLNGLGALAAGFAPGFMGEDGIDITQGAAIQVAGVGSIAAALAGGILFFAPLRLTARPPTRT
jgi:hypothetical protein